MNLLCVKAQNTPSLEDQASVPMAIALEVREVFAVVLPAVDFAGEPVMGEGDIQPESSLRNDSGELSCQAPVLHPLRPVLHARAPQLLLWQVPVQAAGRSFRCRRLPALLGVLPDSSAAAVVLDLWLALLEQSLLPLSLLRRDPRLSPGPLRWKSANSSQIVSAASGLAVSRRCWRPRWSARSCRARSSSSPGSRARFR